MIKILGTWTSNIVTLCFQYAFVVDFTMKINVRFPSFNSIVYLRYPHDNRGFENHSVIEQYIILNELEVSQL
jgi:hypothetical protein